MRKTWPSQKQVQFQCDADFARETLKEHRILVCVSYLLLIFYSKTKSSILTSVSPKIVIHYLLKKKKTHQTHSGFPYLKCEQWHYNCHPADSHGDVCPPLLSDHVHGAQEQHGPHDVIEHHEAQEGHQDPQRNTNNLKERHI